ncbi:MAG: DUF3781 domain-containing protein [Firmicutes bacterium]|nr:DUF3781 domain-containing protein [Bacillota bacterium]
MENKLKDELERLHTTELGKERIRRNLSIDEDDVVLWCRKLTDSDSAVISRKGKNYYIKADDVILTVNAGSYTIITGHRI